MGRVISVDKTAHHLIWQVESVINVDGDSGSLNMADGVSDQWKQDSGSLNMADGVSDYCR